MEFRFDRHGRSHVTVHEVVNEMLGFGVLPLLGMNRERFFTERAGIALAQLREFNFGERAGFVDLPVCDPYGENSERKDRQPTHGERNS